MANANLINIENTRFIFPTNLGGDPSRDRFARPGQPVKRRANIVIPDPVMAQQLMEAGVRVKCTEPHPGEEDTFKPTYYVAAILNFESRVMPCVYLVSDGVVSDPLGPDAVSQVDYCYVLNVDAVLNMWRNPATGNVSLYIQTMYVVQDTKSDPYASKYRHNARTVDGMDTFV